MVFIADKGLPNVLIPVQLRNPSVGPFSTYFPVFTIDVVFLRHATCLTVLGHPIEVLV
jgi:hypothetical protein